MPGASILCCSAGGSTGCCSLAASRELWHLFAETQGMLLTVLYSLSCSAFAERASAYCVELTQPHRKLGAADTIDTFCCTFMCGP